ncbi:MAG: hypothetical protein JXO44_14375, partial [Clostridia bacterium]|nr:hypothetical protein [Clostridia bacterium]
QQQALERLKKLLDQGVGLKTLEVMSATDLPQSPEVLDAVKKAPSSEVAEKARETVVEVIDIPHQEDDIKSKIIELRSQGYSLKQIAKMLDVGLGEIQLILNMKRQ